MKQAENRINCGAQGGRRFRVSEKLNYNKHKPAHVGLIILNNVGSVLYIATAFESFQASTWIQNS